MNNGSDIHCRGTSIDDICKINNLILRPELYPLMASVCGFELFKRSDINNDFNDDCCMDFSLSFFLKLDEGFEEIIGCGLIRAGFISFFVRPEYWMRGIGGRIVSETCRIAFDVKRYKVIYAEVLKNNYRSRGLLIKYGFRSLGPVRIVRTRQGNVSVELFKNQKV